MQWLILNQKHVLERIDIQFVLRELSFQDSVDTLRDDMTNNRIIDKKTPILNIYHIINPIFV